MGAERIDNNGSMVVDFELNKKPFKVFPAGGPPKPDRTAGDLLISLEYSNGGGNPIVTIYAMANVVNFPSGQTVDFVKVSDATTLGAVHSATNFVDLPNSGFGYTIPSLRVRRGVHRPVGARHRDRLPRLLERAHAQPHRRDAASSQLKDTARPFPIDLNNCGKVTIVKDAHPESGHELRLHDHRREQPVGLQPRRRRRPNRRAVRHQDFELVVPGTYTVTEAAEAGWKLTDLDCDDGNPTVNVDTGVGDHQGRQQRTRHLHIHVNTKLGKIIVEKQTDPDGASGSFIFTGDVAGSIGDGGTLELDNLLPGTYTSTETDPAPPFDLGAITCDDSNSDGDLATRTATFDLAAGETIKCTFLNVKRGSITIIKDAQPNDAQDFVFTRPGAGFTLDDDCRPGTLSNTFTASNVVPGATPSPRRMSAAGSSPV